MTYLSCMQTHTYCTTPIISFFHSTLVLREFLTDCTACFPGRICYCSVTGVCAQVCIQLSVYNYVFCIRRNENSDLSKTMWEQEYGPIRWLL